MKKWKNKEERMQPAWLTTIFLYEEKYRIQYGLKPSIFEGAENSSNRAITQFFE
jgi:hypothetical protein